MSNSNVFNIENFGILAVEQKYQDLQKVLDFHNKTFENKASDIFNNIQQLDMKTNTLLFLYTLSGIQVDKNSWQIFDRFFKVLDGEQAAFSIKKLSKMVKQYYDFLDTNKIGFKCIRALQNITQQLNSAGVGLTQVHILLLQVCIENRFYKQALPVIRHPIVNIGKKNDITEVDLCKFYYLSGEILLIKKDYDEAKVRFSDAASFQSQKVHEVHIEAHKKLALLNLRLGKYEEKKTLQDKEKEVKSFSMKSNQQKIVDLACDSYNNLKKLDTVQNQDLFDQLVAQNMDQFTKDGNMGLVNQARFSIVYYYLKELKQVYLKYKINDLWNKIQINPNQVNIHILQQQINKIQPIFRIDQKLNCIEFNQNKEIDHEKQILQPLSNSLNLLKGVNLEFSKEYQDIIQDRLKNPSTNYC